MDKFTDTDARMSFSVNQAFYAVFSFLGVAFLLHFGKEVIVPLAFAFLLSFILYPVCCFFERKGVSRMWSILWVMIIMILLILGVIYLLSSQIISIVREFGDFRKRLQEILTASTTFINEKVPILPKVQEEDLVQRSKEWFSDRSGGLLADVLNNTGIIITGVVLMIIYTFLILLYRHGLKEAFVNFAAPAKRDVYAHMINNIQKVGQKYLTGMFILILILGTLNSTGLLLLGIDYALFFGFLAALLAIIPYVGTIIGGAIPTIYALMHYDSIWYPIGVVLIFWFIQALEGNFLSPTIVGGNLNLNALVAILALITGGVLWGIAGMILSLPYAAIFKVISEHYKELEPVSHVLRDDLYKKPKEGNLLDMRKKLKSIFRKEHKKAK